MVLIIKEFATQGGGIPALGSAQVMAVQSIGIGLGARSAPFSVATDLISVQTTAGAALISFGSAPTPIKNGIPIGGTPTFFDVNPGSDLAVL